MRKILLLSILILANKLFGQQPIDLPTISPPSPEVHALTKYGDLPINESTGKATFNVPVFTYTSGNLTLPISLNYLGNGVKVNAPSTWTGVNWTLNAGGVITRTVHHQPDEYSTERIFMDDIDALGLSLPEDNAESLYLYFNSLGSQWDTQPDVFRFSFGGYSGSFFLDEDFIPVLISGDIDIKIEIQGGQSTNKEKLFEDKYFILTTPDGVKYHFGENQIQDTEKVVLGPEHTNVSPLATTSFYLFKIEHPANGIILLDYIDTPFYKIKLNESSSVKQYLTNIASGGSPFPSSTETAENTNVTYTSVMQNIEQGKFLSRIYSPSSNIEVIFNSDDSIDGRFNFENVLNDIEVHNNGSLFFKADFDYLFNYADGFAQRFFLNKITFNEDFDTSPPNLGDQFKKYEFLYKTPELLPKRFSNNQDHLGYFNDKNNTSLFPNTDHYHFSGYGSADRNSDFDTRSIGVLEKIVYPTKGHTYIEYEAPLKKSSLEKNTHLQTYLNGYQNHIDKFEDVFNDMALTLEETIDANGNIIYINNNPVATSQTIEVKLLFESIDEIIHNSELVSIDFIDVTNVNQPIIITQNVMLNPQGNNEFINGVFVEEQLFNFNVVAGNYYQIKLKLNQSTTEITPMTAKLSISYTDNEELVYGEGVRVKRVSDYIDDFTTIPATSKRYYYTSVENTLKNPLEYVETYKTPKYIDTFSMVLLENSSQTLFCRTIGHPGGVLETSPINYNEEVISNYDAITISYGGDNFENGGVEKIFGKDIFLPVQIINVPEIETFSFESIKKQFAGADWSSVLHGQLLKETIVSKQNGVFYKKQETAMYRSYLNFSSISGLVSSNYIDCGPGPSYPYKNVGLGKYDVIVRKINTASTESKTYLTSYPLIRDVMGELPNENDYKIITTSNLKKYDSSYKGLLTETIISTSETNKEQIIKNKYLDERNSLPGLTTPQLDSYNSLTLKHIIGQPIQSETYKKDISTSTEVLLSTQRTLYKDWGSNLILPETVQTVKGEITTSNALENRIMYHSYYDNGNIQELNKKDGAHIVYIWGYDQQYPIAKIENTTYAQVSSYVSNLQTLSDLDVSEATENTLRVALENLRISLPNAMVITYTYDPLIGVTSIIDPRGRAIYYHYDEFNRLKFVKDHDGNVLSKKEYNYKTN